MTDTLKALAAELDTEREAEPYPVRYCHGCRTYDDAPRVLYAEDQDRPDLDKLYHYDCVPGGTLEDHTQQLLQPIFDARAAGHRDHELRLHAAHHARTLREAPADKKGATR